MLSKKLLSKLRCPKCKGKLIKDKNELRCKKCSLDFDIKKNIPLLYYNPNITLQEKVRSMFNETPYGLVGSQKVLKNRKKITVESLREEPWHINFAIKGKKVLDAGCGGGNLLTRLKLLGAEAYGLDQTQGSLRQIKKNFERYKLEPPLLVEGNIEYIPFAKESFNIICSMGVLHHTQDEKKGFKELVKILKPNGTLYIMVYHKHCLWGYAKDILRFLARRSKLITNLLVRITPLWMGCTAEQSDPRTVFRDNIVNAITKRLSVKEVKKIYKDLNLKIINIKIYEIPTLYGLGKRVYGSRLLRWYEKRFGWLLYVEAKKLGAGSRGLEAGKQGAGS